MTKPTFLRLCDAGHYEFGIIECAADRRKDQMVVVGTAATYQEASRKCAELAFAGDRT